MEEMMRATVFTPKYFPAFLGVTCSISGLAGWHMMETIKKQFPGVKQSLAGAQL